MLNSWELIRNRSPPRGGYRCAFGLRIKESDDGWPLVTYRRANYSINQNFCYILIIPGFGIISTVIAAGSGKNVFGYLQNSSLIKKTLLTQQTICRKVKEFKQFILLDTSIIWNIFSWVKILVMYDNPQVTKAQSENFKLEIKEFFKLSMRVGTSEAICFKNKLKIIILWLNKNILNFMQISSLYLFSLCNNNNYFNSFVNRPKTKLFKQLYNVTNKLNPWYVTGFTDAEGNLLINIRPKSNRKYGYGVELVFRINLHSRDRVLLEKIQKFLGVGSLTTISENYAQYWVGNIKDLSVIVNHFDNYPLITQKWSDFQLFKQAVELVEQKEHLTLEGLNKLISIKTVLNKGLSEELKVTFSNNIPSVRPQVTNTAIPDPNWITGFVDGEGCFNVRLIKTTKGESISLRFIVTQHARDAELLKNLVEYFGCGKYSVIQSSSLHGDFIVNKFEDIKCKIIPFFDKYSLQSEKYLDFLDLKKIMELKGNTNVSLTEESIIDIKQIKSGMNKARKLKPFSNVSTSIPGDKKFYSTSIDKVNQIKYNQWLAGLIDGDGQFKTTKKGICTFQIIMHINDKSLLYSIKHKYGGFVKEISGSYALKYKLQNPKGLIKLVNDINGLIKNPVRIIQLNQICVKYKIELLEPQSLTYNDGWFSGILDSDGSIHIEEKPWQLTISVTQKNRYLLEPLQRLYGGKIDISSSKKDAFKYVIFKKDEILSLVDNYLVNFPLKSHKASRISLIKDFYLLEHHSNLNIKKINKFNEWIQFKNKWDKVVY